MIIKQKNSNNGRIFRDIYIINDYDNYLKFDFDRVNHKPKFYYSEALIITNCKNINDIYLWLDWHINIVKFDHIVFIDNNDSEYLKDICQNFQNVEYIHLPGILSQSDIYTEYVNKSNAQWVLPIDDDEYLYISDEFNNNINDYLIHVMNKKPAYKYAFNWHMMFADEIKNERSNNLFYDFPYEYIGTRQINYNSFNIIKTIVNTNLKHYYCSEYGNKNIINMFDSRITIEGQTQFRLIDNLGTFHNPITKIDDKFIPAYNENDDYFYQGLFSINKKNITTNYACIYHFRYKSKKEWLDKINNFKFNSTDQIFIDHNYKQEQFDFVHNFVHSDLIYNDRLIKLYDNKKSK